MFPQTPRYLIQRPHNQRGVKTRIGNAIGPYEDLLTAVKRRKLKWYGHVTRSSGLAKTILQGTVQGGRRRGRQRKWWEDNIKEWTSLEWNSILRKIENRKEWRKLFVKSMVVPRRSDRLRDRWRWKVRWKIVKSPPFPRTSHPSSTPHPHTPPPPEKNRIEQQQTCKKTILQTSWMNK